MATSARDIRQIEAFTLLEVLLAVLIASGMLFVVLFFYHQAAKLRGSVLLEAEQLSSTRLIFSRLSTELQSLPPENLFSDSFNGSAASISFIYRAPTLPTELETDPSVTYWRSVEYRFNVTSNETTLAGQLFRSERPRESTNATNVYEGNLILTEEDPELATNQLQQIEIPGIEFAQFRFWSSNAWVDTWSPSNGLPAGVEIVLSHLAPLSGEPFESWESSELFRRVIFVPNSAASVSSGAETNENSEINL